MTETTEADSPESRRESTFDFDSLAKVMSLEQLQKQQSLSQTESLLTAPRIEGRDWLLSSRSCCREPRAFEVLWLGERTRQVNPKLMDLGTTNHPLSVL